MTYSNFPNYSWTVEVVTHELGHNIGSSHTQSYSWPGGAIDNCYETKVLVALGPCTCEWRNYYVILPFNKLWY